MSDTDKKKRLVNLLDRKVFEPILKKSPDEYQNKSDQEKLKDVQQSTRSEQKRYRESYQSAEEVYSNFKDDLNSKPAEKIHRESKALGLPTLNDIRDEFERTARDLGIAA